MDLTKLDQSVQSQFRSDMMIHNISRCVTELVENAIDAEATCIAVKLDLTTFQIQVVDNGNGLSKEHLDLIGTRYWFSKCCEANYLKKYFKPHNHRGEFLASIKNACSKLMIVSRAVGDNITYCKIFDESKTETVVEALHQRASQGTTIIINNFFGNHPVRQKRIIPAVEIQNTKRCIQAISLMYPSILFILKDDSKHVEILRIPRTTSTLKTFCFLFPRVIDHRSSMIKVVADGRNVSMRAMICREAHHNRDLQFVFVNKRFMFNSEIQSIVDELLSKKGFFDVVPQLRPPKQRQKPTLSKGQLKNAIFILNICCHADEYRVTCVQDKCQVDFVDKMEIERCLAELIESFWKRGLFGGDSLVPHTAAVAVPEKTKNNFMPRLLFEKMNESRTIRGAPACRKEAAAKPGLNEKEASNSDVAEICRSNTTGEVACPGVFDGLRTTSFPNLSTAEMPSQTSASSSTILEPSKLAQPSLLEESKQTNRCAENEKASCVESTLPAVPPSTPCTHLCIPPVEKPILSTVGLLNRPNVRLEVEIVPEKSISSILNTSKIHGRLQSVGRGSESNTKALFTRRDTHDEECTSSCCILTNSNIPFFDAKKDFYLRKKKTSIRAAKLEGLRIIKLKKSRQVEVNFPRPKKLEHAPKKMTVLKKSILQIDDSLYEPKIQFSQFMFNPKLTSQVYSQKISFNLWNQSNEYSDLPTKVAPLMQISKSSLTFDGRGEGGGASIENQNQIKSIQSVAPKLNLMTVSKTIQSDIEKQIPTVADFIYAPNLKKSNSAEHLKNTWQTFLSESNMTSSAILIGSSEIFTSKKTNSPNPQPTSKMVPYGENCFGKNWLVKEPALEGKESISENSCKVPQCICSCHKMANSSTNSPTYSATGGLADFQSESANANDSFASVTQIFSSLSEKSFTKDATSVEYFPNYLHGKILPSSTNGNAVCESKTAKTHSRGIFSELAKLYSVARETQASRCMSTSISHMPADRVDGMQNETEVRPIFSEYSNKLFSSEVVHGSKSHLTQSMNRCSMTRNSAEASANHFKMFCSNSEEDFQSIFTSRRISSECGEKNSDSLLFCSPGPNDPTQRAKNSFSTDKSNFSIGNTPGPCDPTQLQLSDDSFSVNSKESSNGSPQAFSFPQLVENSFCVNLENHWVGNTPGARFFTRFSRDESSFVELQKSILGRVDETKAPDSTQLENNLIRKDWQNSEVDSLDPVGTNEPIQFTNDSLFTSVEHSTINCSEAYDSTQLVNDSIGIDETNCLTVDATLCADIEGSFQLEKNDRNGSENDSLMEKIQYRRNSKFLGAASVHDIPKGILDVHGTKSKPISYEKSQKIDFNKFTKPCSMKNHLTFDDCGNSCLRIFPLKETIDYEKNDFKFEYGNFPEDLNCSVIFSKMDLKSRQFLAQLENKFLLSSLIMKDSQDQIIVVFDQHAVDERIRVERLSKEYIDVKGVWRSVSVIDTICIRVSRCEMSVILDFRDDFCSRGIDFDFTEVEEKSDDQFLIKVIRVPLCLHNRASREPTKTNIVPCLKQLAESLIKELTHTLMRTRGISRSATPQTLQNIINSEACRGAVKFGEQLSSDICSTLLQSLWSCNLPFQCAHGRPLLAPLANVAKLAHIGKQKLPKRKHSTS